MQITSFTYSRTKQPKDYESVKVEVTAAPSEAQGAIEAFTELAEFVNVKVEEACAAANGAPTKAKPPLADKPKAAKPIPDESPAATEPKKTTKPRASKADKQAKLAKASIDEQKVLQHALTSKSMEELHQRMTGLSAVNDAFTTDEWEQANKQLGDVYRNLQQTTTVGADAQQAVVKLFTSHNNTLQERRRKEQVAA